MRRVFNSPDVFFTSDLHLFHSKVVSMCGRDVKYGFNTIDEMHEYLIEAWNKKVPPYADVFILGDVSFATFQRTSKILERLNGTLHLVVGNHDERFIENRDWRNMFKTTMHVRNIVINDGPKSYDLSLCHYPIYSWNKKRYNSIHLHGHMHGHSVPISGNILDVGVDTTTDFAPYSFAEILDAIDKKIQL